MNTAHFQPDPVRRLCQALEHRLNAYFEQQGLSEYTTPLAVGKTVLFSVLFGATYGLLLLVAMPLGMFLLLWFLMGAFLLRAAISIVQDAARGILFSTRPWMKSFLTHYKRLLSSNGYRYKTRPPGPTPAQRSPQEAPNEVSDYTLVYVTPFTTTRAGHVYRRRYLRLLYPFFLLFWALFRHFQYYQREKLEKSDRVWAQNPLARWVSAFVSKAYYLFYLLVVPAQVLPVAFWQVALGFVCMHLGSGVMAMFAVSAHIAENDPVFVVPNADGSMNFSWGADHLRTTPNQRPRLAQRELTY
ncbi:hypothetical protein AUC43_17580 [Hymenobacter sedentarius]|uniref:Uncharacterized protein n=1 Tax=Hymenobacter sedentarius TaxID=1411621 RepID=A0A0U4BSU3_9BACT|nr:hypothetical protein [Hymenobacter sedentarius]ALW86730.1 hypothetical protein AUC43_17580 [Hymenobacter sedentarius]